MEKEPTIEYLDYAIDLDTGVLSSIVWSFKGSNEIFSRCGDLGFVDSTHHLTKYSYKLTTIIVPDSESKSRSALLMLHLRGDVHAMQKLLQSWVAAFNLSLPEVMFSDADPAIGAAIFSVPEESPVHHLLCTWHLFDERVRKNGGTLLNIENKGSWTRFRPTLTAIRDCMDEFKFNELWKDMLREYCGNRKSLNHQRAKKYLKAQVFSKRHRWALCDSKSRR